MGMLFLAGVRLHQFLLLCVLALGAIGLLIYLEPYRVSRLMSFWEPFKNGTENESYQLAMALIVYGRGSLFGVGLGNSIQKLDFLPEAHTDFVFAILAEEFGLIGTLMVVGLFSVLVYRALRIGYLAEKKQQLFNAYFAYGIGILLGAQSFINMGVNMGLLPTKGLTLPLVSYGGSSLIVSCMCIGVLARIYRDLDIPESVGDAGGSNA